METTRPLRVQVVAPIVDALGLLVLLKDAPDLQVVRSDADVFLLKGSGWESHLFEPDSSPVVANGRAVSHRTVLVVDGGIQELIRAYRFGVPAFVTAETDPVEIAQATYATAQRKAHCCPALLATLLDRIITGPNFLVETLPRPELDLTARELQVDLPAGEYGAEACSRTTVFTPARDIIEVANTEATPYAQPFSVVC